MRSLLVMLSLLLLMPAFASAQQTETLITGDVQHGGFGALLYGVTSVNGEAAYLRGTRGAWSISFRDGHTLNIGLGGYRTRSGFEAVNWQQTDINAPELRMNYGGFELEYLNRSYKLIHYGVQATIGGGDVRYRNRDTDLEKTSDDFFVFQPGANIHLNITNWFRISGGAYYRFTNNVSLEGTSDSDLSGFSAIIGLRFGWFH